MKRPAQPSRTRRIAARISRWTLGVVAALLLLVTLLVTLLLCSTGFAAPRARHRPRLRVEFELGRNWMLQTFFGDAAVGDADLFWHRVFGRPRRLPGNTGPRTPAEDPAGAGGRGLR